jgi:phosphoglycerol transferase MdoB-like AlkP superfamily enzyme
MNLPSIPYAGGFASELKKYGYKSVYFTTHDDQFDNAGGFMYGNDFDSVISKSDYPSDKILSTLGVPDHYLFEFSLPIINKINKNGSNFFISLLTSSNHGPYKIPQDISFKPKNKEITDAIVEYSDWSIKHFFEMAKKTEWFENTIFILTADHGTLKNAEYDFPLCLTHSPLIIYSPKFEKEAKVFTAPAGQIDIFSTIMGLLNVSYVNNSLGYNLLKEKRKYIYFSADDKIGCLSDEFYLIISSDKEYLYRYKNNDLTNYITEYKTTADSMKQYVINMLVGSDYLIKSNLIKVDRR